MDTTQNMSLESVLKVSMKSQEHSNVEFINDIQSNLDKENYMA